MGAFEETLDPGAVAPLVAVAAIIGEIFGK